MHPFGIVFGLKYNLQNVQDYGTVALLGVLSSSVKASIQICEFDAYRYVVIFF